MGMDVLAMGGVLVQTCCCTRWLRGLCVGELVLGVGKESSGLEVICGGCVMGVVSDGVCVQGGGMERWGGRCVDEEWSMEEVDVVMRHSFGTEQELGEHSD